VWPNVVCGSNSPGGNGALRRDCRLDSANDISGRAGMSLSITAIVSESGDERPDSVGALAPY
jgi:hypothetical protein